jgi:hypothetical protein
MSDALAGPLAAVGVNFSFTSADLSVGSPPIFTGVSGELPQFGGGGPQPQGPAPLLRSSDSTTVADDIGDSSNRSGGAVITRDGPVGGDVDPPPAPGNANLHFQVKSVTFNTDHGTIASDPFLDDPNNPNTMTYTSYASQHWLDANNDGTADAPPQGATVAPSGDHRWPAMTIVGQPLKVNEVVFRVWSDDPNLPWPPLDQARVKGYVSGNDVPANMVLTNDDPMVSIGFDQGNELITFHTLSSHATVFDHVAKIYDAGHSTDLRIDWKVIIPNDFTYDGGTSKNVFYVTWKDNTLPNHGNDWARMLFHSVVDISTRGAAGKTAGSSEQDVFAGVWGMFTGRDVYKVNGPLADQGAALAYYRDYRTVNDVTATLLCFTDGRCYAWTAMLIDCARAQGIWSPADAQQNNVTEIRLSDELRAPDNATNDLGWSAFLVSAWTFAAPPQGFAYPYNLMPVDRTTFFGAHQYNWRTPPAPQVDQAAAGNLPAQSNPKPQSLFDNHIIVRYGEDWYDPSFGVKYAAFPSLPDNFAATAVVGYARDNPNLLPNDPNVAEFSQVIPRNMTPNQAFKIIYRSY